MLSPTGIRFRSNNVPVTWETTEALPGKAFCLSAEWSLSGSLRTSNGEESMKHTSTLLICVAVALGGLCLGCNKSQKSDAQDPARPEAIEDLNQLLPPPDGTGRVGGGQPSTTNP